jgi:hypothetical protein
MRSPRGRLVFAAVATAALVAVTAAVAISGSGDDQDPLAGDQCLATWNDDPVATSDGTHAYASHGYRDALLSRDDGRCLVVFATPRVDFEPDFGVRVYDGGRWTGLAAADNVPLEEIEAMQREATETANANLLPTGLLTGR